MYRLILYLKLLWHSDLNLKGKKALFRRQVRDMIKKTNYDGGLSYNNAFEPTCLYTKFYHKADFLSNKISAYTPKLLKFYEFFLIWLFLAYNCGYDRNKNF